MAKKEDALQIQFIKWLKKEYPGTIGISNLAGMKLHPSLTGKARDLQTHTKQADIIVLEGMGGYNGWIFELKRDHGEFLYANGSGFKTKSDSHLRGQVATLRYLDGKGYFTDIGTLEEAKQSLKWYMALYSSCVYKLSGVKVRAMEMVPRYPDRNLDKYGEGKR